MQRGNRRKSSKKKIELVLSWLQKKGCRANLQKSFFMQKEVEYFGYLLTKDGVKPQPKKVEVMNQLEGSKTTGN